MKLKATTILHGARRTIHQNKTVHRNIILCVLLFWCLPIALMDLIPIFRWLGMEYILLILTRSMIYQYLIGVVEDREQALKRSNFHLPKKTFMWCVAHGYLYPRLMRQLIQELLPFIALHFPITVQLFVAASFNSISLYLFFWIADYFMIRNLTRERFKETDVLIFKYILGSIKNEWKLWLIPLMSYAITIFLMMLMLSGDTFNILLSIVKYIGMVLCFGGILVFAPYQVVTRTLLTLTLVKLDDGQE